MLEQQVREPIKTEQNLKHRPRLRVTSMNWICVFNSEEV